MMPKYKSNKGKKVKVVNVVTPEQVISSLKNNGVIFEENKRPFSSEDNNIASILGKYEERVIIK